MIPLPELEVAGGRGQVVTMSESGIKMGAVEDPGLPAELVSGLSRGVACVNTVLVH